MSFGSNVGTAASPALMSALPQQIQNAYTRLSLAPGADTDAVERAYTHALKQIDQDSQGEAFGNLRAAYEAALAWAREHGLGAEDGAAQVADIDRAALAAQPPVSPAAATDASPVAIDAVLDEWLDRLKVLPTHLSMQLPTQRPLAASMNPAAPDFDVVLAQALRDERLAAPAAQQALEARIASVLALDPWQRVGLFEAAVACFHWDTDDCGQLADRWIASWIVQACGESLLWRGQADQERARQLAAIDAALAHPVPTVALLTQHFFAMDTLMSHYGYWLSLRMPNHILQAWSQAYHAPGFKRPAAPKVRLPRARFKLTARMMIILALLVLSVLRLIFYPSASPSQDWPTGQQQSGQESPHDAAAR
ncbi:MULTISPECIES: hypothetical protein [unclassified Achromobacter]|uniref:hypothetical protein n=1 Tax=unclassified Achromobacter TaxID=2626865 RepID=UPI000B519559|nr:MULTISPECIES: hypothetical protein [unclassified Achromobacter]OWT73572.1 hypothetical protein CEY05_20895 [Achromobacter sp. HZ34]OWT79511.1 hypothetical protein CEY04_11085 [Achromobacter sp. HZ28]